MKGTVGMLERKPRFLNRLKRCRHWVVCSTPHALNPRALSPHALSPRALSPCTSSTDGLSENVLSSEKFWSKSGPLDE